MGGSRLPVSDWAFRSALSSSLATGPFLLFSELWSCCFSFTFACRALILSCNWLVYFSCCRKRRGQERGGGVAGCEKTSAKHSSQTYLFSGIRSMRKTIDFSYLLLETTDSKHMYKHLKYASTTVSPFVAHQHIVRFSLFVSNLISYVKIVERGPQMN